MLKTILNPSIFRTVILYATFLCQQQIFSVAGEKIVSAPPPADPPPRTDAGVEKLSDAFARVAQQARTSLVRIQIGRGNTEPDLAFAIPFELGGSDFSSNQLSDPGVESLGTDNSSPLGGSGVIVTDDGYIWTSSEVVRDATSANVILATGESHSGKIVLVDQVSGLAILKIEASGLVPLKLADDREPRIAEWAMAVGADSDNDPIFSTGIVWLHEHATSSRGTKVGFFSYSFPGVQAETGSAIMNAEGQLIGIDVPPPMLFKPADGTRYCLRSDSALAIHRAILTTPISGVSDSITQDAMISQIGFSRNSDQTKHSSDDFRSRRTVRSNEITRDTSPYPQIFATSWLGEPLHKWVDWLKEKLPTALQVGGIDLQ